MSTRETAKYSLYEPYLPIPKIQSISCANQSKTDDVGYCETMPVRLRDWTTHTCPRHAPALGILEYDAAKAHTPIISLIKAAERLGNCVGSEKSLVKRGIRPATPLNTATNSTKIISRIMLFDRRGSNGGTHYQVRCERNARCHNMKSSLLPLGSRFK